MSSKRKTTNPRKRNKPDVETKDMGIKKQTKVNYRKKQQDQLQILEEQVKELEKKNREFLVKEAILKTKSKIYKKQLKYFQDFMQNALSLATRSSSQASTIPFSMNNDSITNNLDFDLLEDQKFI
ncbi:b-zip transcription factor (eurofung) [Anaeramoeba flamelloides]|uniref:B-zip transcription factor (Eurofung) n=1 Tax=Anaeramoeba flamelloides TaxID=1746091 RepID=A0ABQ8Z528_9EUKA|nr:b-zip transcription factor (eurofung) [Anaeramoeba flamelloides]